MFRWSLPKTFKKSKEFTLDILEARKHMMPDYTNGESRYWNIYSYYAINSFSEYLKLTEYGKVKFLLTL